MPDPTPRRTRAILPALVAAGLFLFATACWVSAYEPHLIYPDAYDYAQMGREIHRGHGFATQQTFPRHIPRLAELGFWEEHWPNLYRYPVTPLWTAGVLAAGVWTGVEDPVEAAVIQSGIWFLITVPLVFCLARRFAPLGVAAFCALACVADPRQFHGSHAGLTETFGTLLVVAFFSIASGRSESSWRWGALGILCGLAVLTRTQLVALVPIGLFSAWTAPGNRRRATVLLLAGTALAVVPWLARNAAVAGDPVFSFSTSRNLMKHVAAADLELDLHAPAKTSSYLATDGAGILAKWGANLLGIVGSEFWDRNFGDWISTFLILCVLVVFLPVSDPELRRFRLRVGLFVLAMLVVTALAFHRDRFYDPLRPLLITVACTGFWQFLSGFRKLRSPAWVSAAIGTLLIVAGVQMSLRTTLRLADDARAAKAEGQVHRRAQERLARLVPPGSVVASDVSFRVALDADRRAIRLPREPDQIWEILDQYQGFEYLLLGELSARGSNGYRAGSYRKLTATERFLAEFELRERLEDGGLLYARRKSTGRNARGPGSGAPDPRPR